MFSSHDKTLKNLGSESASSTNIMSLIIEISFLLPSAKLSSYLSTESASLYIRNNFWWYGLIVRQLPENHKWVLLLLLFGFFCFGVLAFFFISDNKILFLPWENEVVDKVWTLDITDPKDLGN